MRRDIDDRTGTVARIFDRVVDVLGELDYVAVTDDGATVLTPAGRTMRRIYGERDLLVSESLRTGIWQDLDAASLATLACCLVYEPRRDDAGTSERGLPRGPLRAALSATESLWQRLDDLEQEHRLPGTDAVATGLAPAMHLWARGVTLDRVLIEADMAAGDFVRWAKQTIDLLDQLSLVADAPLATTARRRLRPCVAASWPTAPSDRFTLRGCLSPLRRDRSCLSGPRWRHPSSVASSSRWPSLR